MDEGLPKAFDVVVVGTGVAESIVSAAVSRSGHTVLHLDPREYYGSSWATLNLDSIRSQDFANVPSSHAEEEEGVQVMGKSGCCDDTLGWIPCYRDVEQVVYDEGAGQELDKVKKKFNIDLSPQVIMARDEMIELLIKSDVSRYLEFLPKGRIFTTWQNEDDAGDKMQLLSIPLSKSDVFVSKSVSLREKRLIIKFGSSTMLRDKSDGSTVEDEDLELDLHSRDKPRDDSLLPDDSTTFDSIMKTFCITPKLQRFFKSAVENVEDGFSPDEFNTEFYRRFRLHLNSIGRFNNQTPYLWPLYGVGEICQAFCRLSAVYGGIFILQRSIDRIHIKEDATVEVTSGGDVFTTKHLVLGPEFSSVCQPKRVHKCIGRGIVITQGGRLKEEEDTEGIKNDYGFCMYRIENLHVIELGSNSHAVPKDYRILHIWFAASPNDTHSTSPKSLIDTKLSAYVDFHTVAASLDRESSTGSAIEESSPIPVEECVIEGSTNNRPKALYGCYFWQDLNDTNFQRMDGIHSCAVSSVNLTSQIERATTIFHEMFPGEEFLPKPIPVEVEGEEEAATETTDIPDPEESNPQPDISVPVFSSPLDDRTS